jgi:hypothetical protein
MTAIRNTDVLVLGKAAEALAPIAKLAKAAQLFDGGVWFLIGCNDFMRAGDLDGTRHALNKLDHEIIRRGRKGARATSLTFLRSVRGNLNYAARAWERFEHKVNQVHVYVGGAQFLEFEHLRGLLECDRILQAEIQRRYAAMEERKAA